MSEFVNKIIGQKIISVRLLEYDVTGIGFQDGSGLTCYYPLIFEVGKDPKSIIGDELKDINETPEEIDLIFHHQIIRINKKLDLGPEFMQLKIAGDDRQIIWNE